MEGETLIKNRQPLGCFQSAPRFVSILNRHGGKLPHVVSQRAGALLDKVLMVLTTELCHQHGRFFAVQVGCQVRSIADGVLWVSSL